MVLLIVKLLFDPNCGVAQACTGRDNDQSVISELKV